MRKTIVFLGAVASASAFTASPAGLALRQPGPSAMATARPLLRKGATSVKMMDSAILDVLAAAPGIAALAALASREGSLGGATATVAAPAAAPIDIDIGLARNNFKRWNDALQTKNAATVANMYTADPSFLPTVSGEHIKRGGSGTSTEDYFVEFVKKNPFGTITDDSIQVYSADAYLHSGMYTFELGEGDARAPVEARFSYVWKKVNGDWKISHHHSSVRPGAPDMTALARDNFKRWNDALQTKNAATVANMYTSDPSFLPTVSPKHIKKGGVGTDTEDYFVEFVKKNPFGTITDDKVQVFAGGDAYLHSGLYTFELGDAGARTPVEARFSYVWKKVGGDWKIAHHHSSVTPGVAPAAPDMAKMATLARDNFKRWNDALQTKNAQTVAKMYTAEPSFLPTVSGDHIKKGGVGTPTEDYFVEFVKKNPFGTITDDSVQVFSNGDAYLHSGMYTFELGDAGARTPVEARFSYVWQKDGGDWKIAHHHSSVRPGVAPAKPDMVAMAALARTNFGRWNDALQTKNADTVAAMYDHSDLSFLPTVSGKHIKDGSNTKDYFVDFVQKNPFGTITDDSIQVMDGGNTYLHTGMYTFELGEPSDRTPVEARFSYLWRKVDGDWKIGHHHSSVRPADKKAEAASDKVTSVAA